MQFKVSLDTTRIIEWGISLSEAAVFSWLTDSPKWAEQLFDDGQVWFFVARTKACEELPFVTDKPDTMYRHYKSLEENGLIRLKKVGLKDYISLQKKAAGWFAKKSDLNPSPGKKSGSRSEKNPTYQPTRNDQPTKEVGVWTETETVQTPPPTPSPDDALPERSAMSTVWLQNKVEDGWLNKGDWATIGGDEQFWLWCLEELAYTSTTMSGLRARLKKALTVKLKRPL